MNLFKKKRVSLDKEWITTLAIYNSEKRRGILHADWWKDEMYLLQDRFNKMAGQRGSVLPVQLEPR